MDYKLIKLHRVIYAVRHKDGGSVIYKVSDCEEKNKSIKYEFNMIQHMSTLDPDFMTFDNYYSQQIQNGVIELPFYNTKLKCKMDGICKNHNHYFENDISLLYTVYNSKLVTIFDYCGMYKNMTIEIVHRVLNKINTVFRPNNFVHGDLKGDNIMYNISTHELKIIDLEFSLLCKTEIIELTDDNSLSLYLGNVKVTERYLQLFDIYLFCASLITCTDAFGDISKIVRNDFVASEDHNEVIKDFTVIYTYLYLLGDSKLRNRKDNTILGSFDFINRTLMNVIDYNLNDMFNEHVVKIQNIIMENIALNITGNKETDIITVEDIGLCNIN